MEDIIIGRQKMGKVVAVSVTTTAAQVIPAAPGRTTLVLGYSTTTRITWSTDPGLTLDGGLTTTNNGGQITLTVEIHGNIVEQAWFAITSAGTVTAGYLESILPR